MELLVYPAIYLLWKWRSEVRHLADGGQPALVVQEGRVP
jgi:hypothetical protein